MPIRTESIMFEGRIRSYVLAWEGIAPRALFAFHGGSGSGRGFLDHVGDLRSDYLLVLPDAEYHDGRKRFVAPGNDVEDPGVDLRFVDAVRKVVANRAVAVSTWYGCGFSSGGKMVHYLQSARPGTFAGLAAIGKGREFALGPPAIVPGRFLCAIGTEDDQYELAGQTREAYFATRTQPVETLAFGETTIERRNGVAFASIEGGSHQWHDNARYGISTNDLIRLAFGA